MKVTHAPDYQHHIQTNEVKHVTLRFLLCA